MGYFAVWGRFLTFTFSFYICMDVKFEIPLLSLGTFKLKGDECIQAVSAALIAGIV